MQSLVSSTFIVHKFELFSIARRTFDEVLTICQDIITFHLTARVLLLTERQFFLFLIERLNEQLINTFQFRTSFKGI